MLKRGGLPVWARAFSQVLQHIHLLPWDARVGHMEFQQLVAGETYLILNHCHCFLKCFGCYFVLIGVNTFSTFCQHVKPRTTFPSLLPLI